MLFNSPSFLFLFLPTTVIVYLLLNRRGWFLVSKVWVACASLLFYGYANVEYLPLISGSIIFNYLIGMMIGKCGKRPVGGVYRGKGLLVFGILADLALLAYFKYARFFLAGINDLTNAQFPVLRLIFPLGISFFTFTQVAYLVDAYREATPEYDLLNYALFVSFFPRLLAGPIMRYKEMRPQLEAATGRTVNYGNLATAIFLLSIGLFKKVVLAHTCAEWANSGFNNTQVLTFVEAWVTSLSYSLELYFDFSGYTDMALGAALMFNFKIPVNFNSPYRAITIQDFWARWHMTLSRFLRDYVYIPLGGSRHGEYKTYQNLLITFLVCGLWHGSGWLFIFWGFLHGVAMVVHRLWRKLDVRMNAFLAWVITFNFINASWVFFRAKDWRDATGVLRGMVGINGIKLPVSWSTKLGFLSDRVTFTKDWLGATQGSDESILVITGLFLMVLFAKNSNQMAEHFRPGWATALFTVSLLFIAFVYLLATDIPAKFIYLNF
jgi:alginate O-acetyltransferase complex protein AlgI